MVCSNRRQRAVFDSLAGLTVLAPVAVWMAASLNVHVRESAAALARVGTEHAAGPATPAAPRELSVRELLEVDPMAVVRMGRERYEREITNWRSILIKQELLPDGLSPVQEIEVRFREGPRTVFMIWKTNANGARRAMYIPDDPRFTDKKGRKLARVEPNGTLVRLVTVDVFVEIHGSDARNNSRRTIDECGFGSTFTLLEKFNKIAADDGVLKLTYDGEGEIDGRKTFRIVRHLPYQGPNGRYPDACMVLHLDQEWLLPVGVYSYGDHDQNQLLGMYVFTKVELNPGLTDEHFRF